jgi:hypothetical protein
MTNGKTGVGIPFGIRHFNQDWQFHFGLQLGVSPDSAEDAMQGVRFPPNFARFEFQIRFGYDDHSQKKLGFTRLLSAGADPMFEIRLGNAIIGFAVIRADAGARADQLINQPVVDRTPRNFFGEANYHFTKAGGSLFQVVNRRRHRVA